MNTAFYMFSLARSTLRCLTYPTVGEKLKSWK